MKFTVGSCFSGIGGLELGLERTGGFETRWQIENNPYASAVLAKHWPKVKRYGDIITIKKGQLEAVDLICGGYPCQPFSYAGRRLGTSDARHLWPYMLRIIQEIRPPLCLLENVPGHLNLGFSEVLEALAESGYDAEWGMFSAAGVGAPHLRKRIFILANRVRGGGSPKYGKQQEERATLSNASGEGDVADPQSKQDWRIQSGRFLPDFGAKSDVGNAASDIERRQREAPGEQSLSARGSDTRSEICDSSSPRLPNRPSEAVGESIQESEFERSNWWTVEPNVGRVAHGIPSRVDRLRCLGNAVVPQVAQKVGQMILDYMSK